MILLTLWSCSGEHGRSLPPVVVYGQLRRVVGCDWHGFCSMQWRETTQSDADLRILHASSVVSRDAGYV
jgi:hypothetical protein